jgi:hypothetical protein
MTLLKMTEEKRPASLLARSACAARAKEPTGNDDELRYIFNIQRGVATGPWDFARFPGIPGSSREHAHDARRCGSSCIAPRERLDPGLRCQRQQSGFLRRRGASQRRLRSGSSDGVLFRVVMKGVSGSGPDPCGPGGPMRTTPAVCGARARSRDEPLVLRCVCSRARPEALRSLSRPTCVPPSRVAYFPLLSPSGRSHLHTPFLWHPSCASALSLNASRASPCRQHTNRREEPCLASLSRDE